MRALRAAGRASTRVGSALLLMLSARCAPEDIYLFERDDQAVNSPSDSVNGEPDASNGGAEPTQPELDPQDQSPPASNEPEPAEPAASVQPPCAGPACDACLTQEKCAGTAEPLCHPLTGECVTGCDPRAGDEAGNCANGLHCNATFSVCVACTTNAQCAAPTAACDEPRGTCVACIDASTCAAGAPVCDTRAFECVECVVDGDCAARLEVCDELAQRCVECERDADCAGRAELGGDDDDEALLCSPSQRCVECLTDADCERSEPDKPFCSSSLECEDERE